MVVRQVAGGKFAIGRLAISNRGVVFVPRDEVRFNTRKEAEAALQKEVKE